jgi:hypothetical protein
VIQPIFHPVVEKVLPADEIDRVRSAARERRDRHVRALEDEVFVHLVGHDDRVVPFGEPDDLGAHLRSEDRARQLCGSFTRMIRVRSVTARASVRIGLEVGEAQWHGTRRAPGERRARRVGVVVGLEDDDLVIGAIDEREDRRREGFGRARCDDDLALGVPIEPVEVVLVRGDACRSRGTPRPGAYWFAPAAMAAKAASSTSAGPSSSGKPCPRLMAPVRVASAVISAKIVGAGSRPRPAVRRPAPCGATRRESLASRTRYMHRLVGVTA